ncbi:hypothetical protein [Deinococcus ficus]|uniref:hypothetical protein n=1 Tax=Deinococcus ficus TaxID=317577 RepID=UPI0003B76E6A|nr:hypothetical protein [Deinococcus ficus]
MLDEYADDLAAVGGHLYLSGVDADVAQLRRSHKFALDDSVHIEEAQAVVGESTRQAHTSAGVWLSRDDRTAGRARSRP